MPRRFTLALVVLTLLMSVTSPVAATGGETVSAPVAGLEPRFQEHFVAANAIPHASAAFPHLGPLPRVAFNAEGGRRRRRG